MHVPEVFSDHGMFMFLYTLMEMAASVANIIRIARITYEFRYYTLLVYQGRLQEYLTEPLDRKPARQAEITLAGKY